MMRLRIPSAFFISLVSLASTALALLPQIASAQQIYQWTDSKGKVHYSNTPRSESKALDLPKLGRENIDERIQKIRRETPDTCIKHNGIDCPKGPDTDGSVVCIDGYRDAILPFQFECLEARLQGELGLELIGDGEETIPQARNLARVLNGRSVKAYRLNVRNLSGVAATGISVEIVLGRKQRYPALGPDRIEAYGSAEYSLSLAENHLAPTLAQLEQSEYKVTCANCGAVMRRQSSE